jgi:hypothetical protein
MSIDHWWMILKGENRYTGRKIHPGARLPTRKLTRNNLEWKRYLHGSRQATNRLSYGTAYYKTNTDLQDD